MTARTHPAPPSPGTDAGPPALNGTAGRAVRLVLGIVLIAAGIVTAAALWGTGAATVATATTSHPAVGRVAVELEANGSLEVRVHDLEQVVVDERIETTTRTVDTDQRLVGDTLSLASARCQPWFASWFDRCSASFVVTVPAGTEVVGTVAHGDLEVRGLEDRVALRTGHGGVTARDTGGPLDLRTGHGSIRVQRTNGEVTADTGHGDVRLNAVDGAARVTTGHGAVEATDVGDLQASTSHGAIDVTGSRGATVTLTTGHGAVTLAPHEAPETATVRTSHGTVDVTLPEDAPAYAVTTHPSGGSAHIDVATDPGADRRLEVSTGHGQIQVSYATP